MKEKLAPIITRKTCLKCPSPCCKVTEVCLSQREQAQFRKGLFPLKARFAPQGGLQKPHIFLAKKPSGWCFYFDYKNKKCSIYDQRPDACKRWYCGRNTKRDTGWARIKEMFERRTNVKPLIAKAKKKDGEVIEKELRVALNKKSKKELIEICMSITAERDRLFDYNEGMLAQKADRGRNKEMMRLESGMRLWKRLALKYEEISHNLLSQISNGDRPEEELCEKEDC